MSHFVLAQAVGEYVNFGSLTQTLQQTWNLMLSRAENLDFTTWLIIGGVVLVIAVLWGLRPPI
jgi:hypothetical protein